MAYNGHVTSRIMYIDCVRATQNLSSDILQAPFVKHVEVSRLTLSHDVFLKVLERAKRPIASLST